MRRFLFAVPLALIAAAVWAFWPQAGVRTATGLDWQNPEVLALGRTVYAENCAACHGADLEGQADWRQRGPDGLLPAPPHDESGHTWHHSDEILLRIVKEGTAAIVGGGYESDMPGFAEVLGDEEIRAVVDYIKSTWPERARSYQQRMSQPD